MTSHIKNHFNDRTDTAARRDTIQASLNQTRIPENEMFKAAPATFRMQREQNFDEQQNGSLATEEQRRRAKEREDAADFAEAMLDAQQEYMDAMQDARDAVSDLGKAVDEGQEELDRFNEELDKSTIILSDGTKAYFNEETKRFEKQDEQGNWHKLEEEQEAEAQTEFIRKGVASTKQDKMKADVRQADIDRTHLFGLHQQQRLDDIDQRVNNGDLSPEEGEKQTRDIERETREAEKEFRDRWRNNAQNPTPATAAEQEQVKREIKDEFLEDGANDLAASGSAFKADGSRTSGNISAADVEIQTQEDLTATFMLAATGDQTESNTPAPEFNDMPDVDAAAFTRAVTGLGA
ncbi:MAG: hypothetical protein AB2765_19670 [Candidatus Thiodiazotropha endolucinida]